MSAWLRVIDRPVLRLVSVDLGARADISSLAEVFDFARDHLGLQKAAVIASGLVPPGIKVIKGTPSQPGDPEAGISRGRLMPRHRALTREGGSPGIFPAAPEELARHPRRNSRRPAHGRHRAGRRAVQIAGHDERRQARPGKRPTLNDGAGDLRFCHQQKRQFRRPARRKDAGLRHAQGRQKNAGAT